MDRIWQWVWDRQGARYSWAIYAVACGFAMAIFRVSAFAIIAFEQSGRYLEAVVIVAVAVPVMIFVNILPGLGGIRVVEQWAGGHQVDPGSALEATYDWARIAIAGDTGIGDSLPRSRPTFAAWSNVAMLAAVFGNATSGAILGAVVMRASAEPLLAVGVGALMAVGFAVPITVGASSSQSFLPIRDLARGTERVPLVITASGCRWFRTTTWVRWRRRSTGCRRVWLSDNGFRWRSGRMSIRRCRRDCSNRAMTRSQVSAARSA